MLNKIEKIWNKKLDAFFGKELTKEGFIPVEEFSNNYYLLCEVY